jgi:hypothetical protein
LVVPDRDVRHVRSLRAFTGGHHLEAVLLGRRSSVVPVLLGGTTWASDGFWAPAGAFALISRLAMVVWVAVLSGSPCLADAIHCAPERASFPNA